MPHALLPIPYHLKPTTYHPAMLPSLESLSLQEQVAQMFVVRASGYLFDHQIKYPQWEPPNAQVQYLLQDLGVGGVILLGGSAGELALRSQQLQNWAKFPLLIAADVEEGVGQRFSGATWFPPLMAIGAIAHQNLHKAQHYAAQMGSVIAQESLAIGINWVLAPVVDVNNNPANPVINVRAFGETTDEVSLLATAFIRGAQSHQVLTTAKHFPGHGDTALDSHLELPVLPHSSDRLAEIELPPFAAVIAAGVDTIMTAHLLIPAWDAERPATLSQRILTQELRQNLGFQGLIVTDALVMGAIANQYGANEAPVLAIEAGADILLMPVDPVAAIQAVCDAVTSGRIPTERIRASVERIWQAKGKILGENKQKLAPDLTDDLSVGSQVLVESKKVSFAQDPAQISDLLAQPLARQTVTNILQDSQIVRGSVPLSPPTANAKLRNLIVVDDVLDCKFLDRQATAVSLPKHLGYQLQLIDCHTPWSINPGDESFSLTLLQMFIRGNPFRGSAGINQLAEDLFKHLLTTHQLQALVIYGSPYIGKHLLPSLPPEIPYVFSYGQIPAAQAIALKILFF